MAQRDESFLAQRETADVETSSEAYARRFSGAVGSWFLQVQEEATLQLLEDVRASRVLDVGGGHGQIAGPLVDAGYRVTVTGSAEGCASRIEDRLRASDLRFVVVDNLRLPFEDRAFDVVLSYRLLPHVSRWRRLLAELARVAGRAVLVDYPTIRSVNVLTPLLYRFKAALEEDTRPYRCFRRGQVISTFRDAGFRPAGTVAEFGLPMVLHRRLASVGLSRRLEAACRRLGFTTTFGSPLIHKFVPDERRHR